MSDRSAIEWTDATWNPVTGCTKVSPGCDNCYAETFAERWRGIPGHPYEQGFDLRLWRDRLDQPLSWRNPRRVFVNSMSDLFHDDVPDSFIADVFAVMAVAERHTFQVLTKRHGRLRSLLNNPAWVEDISLEIAQLTVGDGHPEPSWSVSRVGDWWPLPNVWIGVSVEDQKRADLRIPALLDTPAAVRFLSCEPLLGPVDLDGWLFAFCRRTDGHCPRLERGARCEDCLPDRQDLHWVIVGGESGHGARPMHPDWVRRLRDRCWQADVPFFFKQFGAWGELPRDWPERLASGPEWRRHGTVVAHDGCHFPAGAGDDPEYQRWCREHDHTRPNRLHAMYRVGKKAAGRELDGRTWDEMPAPLVEVVR